MIHPQGLTQSMINLQDVGPLMLAHLQQETSVHPELISKVEAFASLLRTRLDGADLHSTGSTALAPVLTTRYATQYGDLAFFGMFTTFGTPQDITLASLRVEHLFAADETTQALLQTQIPSRCPMKD